jgi:hypothetical protein
MTGSAQEPERDRDDLPPLPGPLDETDQQMPVIRPGPAAQDTPTWRPEEHQPVVRRDTSPTQAGELEVSMTGIFSSVKRTGQWEVPPVLSLVQFCADVRLDFREAIVTSPVVEVKLYGAMSDVKIVVPPGVAVDLGSGFSLMSDEKQKGDTFPVDPHMWRMKVKHYGAMSDIKVITLAPGDTESKWWKKFT